jgi:hypothetical protein
MQNNIVVEHKVSWLEKFGLYYLDFFKQRDKTHSAFDFSDIQLANRVKKITRKGILLSCLIGIACVFPTVWVDVHFAEKPWYIHYGWVVSVTLVSIIIEFYILFLIALKAVYEVSDVINLKATQNEFIENKLFGIKNILARTALEVPDPELKILGIDPFKRISKKNLFVLGLLYKAKIIVTNFILKYALLFLVGKTIFGISILYEAILVECFWNSVVIKRVILEARLRLFGFVLANKIVDDAKKENVLQQLSTAAKQGIVRAIGNAVVMTQNYHPNMIILLLRFQQELQIEKENKFDDWNLFLQTLDTVPEKEKYFLLDLFTVSAAFDGKISQLEEENLKAAYKDTYTLYYPRIIKLTEHLKLGKLNAALSLCKLDFEKG